jgi:hypothetical protein
MFENNELSKHHQTSSKFLNKRWLSSIDGILW